MAKGYFGNQSGPGPSRFKAYIEFRTTAQEDGRAWVQYKKSIYVYSSDSGYTADFWGTSVWRTWGGNVSLHTEGWYGDSGWTDYGWVNYGSSASTDCRCGYNSYESKCSASYAPDRPTWRPYDITGASAVRNSDNKNTISWTNHPVGARPYSGIYVYRQIDGGEWSLIATVSGGATSYADASTSPNHSYRYRLDPYNGAGTATNYAYTSTLYNTPCAPGKPSATRSGETSVSVKLANDANTATTLEMQRTTNTGDSSKYVDLPVQSGKVTAVADNPGGGTFYYRARNARGTLKSAWSAWSNAVVTICAPAAPTLSAPASGFTVAKTTEQVEFAWKHNPIDGSAQTAAQLQYSADDGSTWATVEVAGCFEKQKVPNTFSVNDTVTWRVRTKGAHADYGPWSANRVFYVKQVPTVVFNRPEYGILIENTPIHVELAYSDQSGNLAGAKLAVKKGGETVYERDMGAALSCDITSAEFLPENGATYSLFATVRSSSTLQASAVRDVTVSFVPPADGKLDIEADASTGYVRLLADVEDDSTKAKATGVSVYRITEGKRKPLGEDMPPGSALVDMYAPINAPYSYEVVTFADSGMLSTVTVPVTFESPRFYFYFFGDVASIEWEPSESIKITKPNRKRVHYAGRKYPVSYDSAATSDERTVSGLLMEVSESQAFRRLMDSGGRCVYKNGDGEVFGADAEVTLSPDYEAGDCYGTVSVDVVRIDGGDL